jgi:hypothetical protein
VVTPYNDSANWVVFHTKLVWYHIDMNEDSAEQKIDHRIEELGGWRGQALAKVRSWIHEADPEVVEEWKWASATKPGVPVWSHQGIICTGESYKDHLKLTFLSGGSLNDPTGLFPKFEGGGRRGLNIYEQDQLDGAAFKELIREAVALNELKKSKG